MGIQTIQGTSDGQQRRLAMRRLLDDLHALELMLERGMFETDTRRIGAEQEVVLVNGRWQPAPIGPEVLEGIDDQRATTEIGRYNIEFNCSPRVFTGRCLHDLHTELTILLARAGAVAEQFDASVLLTGICPTIDPADLHPGNITPRDRYHQLDEVITKLRGGRYELRIMGVDELTYRHNSVLIESLNTSFQLHYQVAPDEFAAAYNAAQLIAGPVLAACCNSPVLFGKRLWCETRIAIFEQAVDTRNEASPAERDMLARVRFGEKWVRSSVLELYKEDITRFRVFFGSDTDEHSADLVEKGTAPKLSALQTHNSTVYRWNRPCYGITDGKPHLRIENRLLPSGPSVVDEVANAAFWFGLMHRVPQLAPDLPARMEFAHAKGNFISAARQGLGSQMNWLDGRVRPVRDLILDTLIPEARRGLTDAGIDRADIDHYLGIIRNRVETRKTGAQWMLDSVSKMDGRGSRSERLSALAAGTFARQNGGQPVHKWQPADLGEGGHWTQNFHCVGQYMTTDLFTVQQDELIDLAASIMNWERVRHVPVEDNEHRLVGLVSYRGLLKVLADAKRRTNRQIAVSDIMEPDPVTVTPETLTVDAITTMREQGVSCLPVVTGGKLVGIITEHDFAHIASILLEDQLRTTDACDEGKTDAAADAEPKPTHPLRTAGD